MPILAAPRVPAQAGPTLPADCLFGRFTITDEARHAITTIGGLSMDPACDELLVATSLRLGCL